jgi:hypothetical protein
MRVQRFSKKIFLAAFTAWGDWGDLQFSLSCLRAKDSFDRFLVFRASFGAASIAAASWIRSRCINSNLFRTSQGIPGAALYLGQGKVIGLTAMHSWL